jgi:hypothetical protein
METRQCVSCGKDIIKRGFSVPIEKTYCCLSCVSPMVATADEVYDAIVQYKIANDGNSPSRQYLADELGYKSKQGVVRLLKQLVSDGRIRLIPRSSDIQVVDAVWLPPIGYRSGQREQ